MRPRLGGEVDVRERPAHRRFVAVVNCGLPEAAYRPGGGTRPRHCAPAAEFSRQKRTTKVLSGGADDDSVTLASAMKAVESPEIRENPCYP